MKNPSISIKRIFKAGYLNFKRNKTIAFSSIAILTTTLLIIGSFFFLRGVFSYTMSEVQNKVDIKIYFKLDASPSQVSEVRDKIATLPEVESATMTTAEDALNEFKEKHANDAIIIQALNEVGVNPFGAMITVIAKDTNSYESIANSLNSGSEFLGDAFLSIDKINYYQLKDTITRLNSIVKWITTVGYWITLVFILMSSLIIFNTIRLSIFIFREEIAVMKLVGASNMHIRGPFLVEASLYALISSVLAMIIFLPITYYLAKKTVLFFNGFNLFNFYIENLLAIFVLLIVVSLVLSLMSSVFAMRKYLKI